MQRHHATAARNTRSQTKKKTRIGEEKLQRNPLYDTSLTAVLAIRGGIERHDVRRRGFVAAIASARGAREPNHRIQRPRQGRLTDNERR
ncbi:hypothetical protein EVAR_20070_1 [Eumeta japonica]|uniref:Uncharacterized protein n=1 Tax=Eumeta variegata TaxID=151549 RepID=A0A4C1UJC4_EUMVA|nr:hypothetical protein EVAR_20070_1 [Eumeta japonica]